jgi:hypothetical protein
MDEAAGGRERRADGSLRVTGTPAKVAASLVHDGPGREIQRPERGTETRVGRARGRPRPRAPAAPTETVLYDLVRENLESFVAYAREHYDGGLPQYVEREMRAYLKCGVFSEGFTRARCDACGHDLLVAFSCKTRTVCPSCTGRRMANAAAAIVDRVLPDVPVRQYVLTLPYELRKLAAFKADVLTAIGRIAIETIFAATAHGPSAKGSRMGIVARSRSSNDSAV